MARAPFTRTADDEVRVIEVHLKYELDMLCDTYFDMRVGGRTVIEQNGMVESFCIHMRVLREFLTKPKQRQWPDSAYADDYVAGFDIDKNVVKQMEDFDERVNVQIAHLSYKRRAEWNLKIHDTIQQQTIRALKGEIDRFLAELAKARPTLRVVLPQRWAQIDAPPTAPAGVGDQHLTTSSVTRTVLEPDGSIEKR